MGSICILCVKIHCWCDFWKKYFRSQSAASAIFTPSCWYISCLVRGMIIFGYTSAFFKQWLYFAFKGARSIDRTWYLDIRLFSALDCCEIDFFLILSRQQSPFNRFHSIFPIVHSILYLFRKKIKSAECETGFRQRFANGCFASISYVMGGKSGCVSSSRGIMPSCFFPVLRSAAQASDGNR